MQISYRNKQLQKVCESYSEACKKHGTVTAKRIHKRIKQLSSAVSVEELVNNRIGRCHPLLGDKEGQYAMDLEHPARLVFVQLADSKVEICIIGIEDYH